MNKVIFLIGTIVISLLGAMFFALGAFSVAQSIPPTQVDVQPIDTYMVPEKQLFQKIEKMISPDVDRPSGMQQKSLKTPQRKVTVEMLLQDVASKHTPESDRCAKGVHEHKSVTQCFVFVGCFSESSAYEIAKALRANGYVTHVEYMAAANNVLVLCGPFKSKMSAETLYKWLLSQGYVEARMIEPIGYQTVWNMPYNAEALSAPNTQYTQISASAPKAVSTVPAAVTMPVSPAVVSSVKKS